MSDTKRIAKNTIFLYIRMILIMGVTLYTSRIILDKLGLEDYGLYNVVGGVVGMLSFLTGTLSIGTSRFITFELGAGDEGKSRDTFSTCFYIHLLLGLLMIILLETGGLWFLYNKLIIPVDRLSAAVIVFHISIFTMFINMLQIPYTSDIMAREEMNIYAYISVFEAIAKLVVVYLLIICTIDKLVVYASLLCVVQLITTLLYVGFCTYKFPESHLKRIFDKDIFNKILKFSGWNVIANITEVLKLQGILVLMNIFFLPAVVGAQAFANQIAAAVMQFITNFRTAINPQIIKLYAAGNFSASKRLVLSSTVYSFDLVLLLALPTIFLMDKILAIWLVKVPDYTVVFAQWVLIQRIISVIDTSLYSAMMASGKIKSNSIGNVFFGIGQFILLYILLKLGFSVMWVQYMNVFAICGFSFIVKPYILYNDIDYNIKELLACYIKCFKITIGSLIIPLLWTIFVHSSSMLMDCLYILLIIIGVIISSLIFMERTDRCQFFQFALNKICGKNMNLKGHN